MLKKIFGNSPRKAVIRVHHVLGPGGALVPERAGLLIEKIQEESKKATQVVLDFSDVGAVNSGFANSLFLGLSDLRPLSEWREIIGFESLSGHQQEILSRSLKAVRNAIASS